MNDNKGDFYISTILDTKDDIDKDIQSSTVAMIMGLNINNFIISDKNKWDDYFTKIIDLATSLQKMNEHYRKYLIEEKRFLEEYRTKCMAVSEANTHSSTTAVSLSTELDGFLSHFKSGLDTLATTLNPLLGFNLNGWHKEKEKSGKLVIKSLENNLDDTSKDKAKPLITYIEENIDWVTYIVNLRDKVHHRGGLKEVTNVFYDFRTKEVIPQRIIHLKESQEFVRDYMERTIHESVDYFKNILIGSLLIKVPGNDMFIAKNIESEYPPYRWFIRNLQK